MQGLRAEEHLTLALTKVGLASPMGHVTVYPYFQDWQKYICQDFAKLG